MGSEMCIRDRMMVGDYQIGDLLILLDNAAKEANKG